MSQHSLGHALRRARMAPAFLAALLIVHSSIGAAPTAASEFVRPAAPAAGTGSASPSRSQLEDALARRLARAQGDSHAPGMSMAVVADDGRTWVGASGRGDDGKALTPGAPQTVASVTKSFTAAIVMQLAEEGRIDLGAPANRYLPKVKLLRQVRVGALLKHTSGIADLYGPAESRLVHRPNRALSSNEVLRPIGANLFPPSKGYAYSNTNFYLLGLIIEVVTGRSFNEVLAERITGPLGLEHTRLLTAKDSQLPPAWSTAFWTSGAIVAPPGELARFGHALYGGDLVSKTSRARMTNFDSGHRYGLGTQLLPLGSRKVPGHSGLLYATTSLLVHLPKERVTIAIFGTAPHTDLEAALVRRYGGRSLVDVAIEFAR